MKISSPGGVGSTGGGGGGGRCGSGVGMQCRLIPRINHGQGKCGCQFIHASAVRDSKTTLASSPPPPLTRSFPHSRCLSTSSSSSPLSLSSLSAACLSPCLSASLSISVSLCLSVFLSVSVLSLSLCLSVCLKVCLPACLPACLPVCLCLSLSPPPLSLVA